MCVFRRISFFSFGCLFLISLQMRLVKLPKMAWDGIFSGMTLNQFPSHLFKKKKRLFMIKSRFLLVLPLLVGCLWMVRPASGCTGITLKSADGACVLARTIEWGGSELNCNCVVVPRGHRQWSLLPGGEAGGMEFSARYGYVGLSVEQENFIAEGLNEVGLSAGLFYFPHYGAYEAYDASQKRSSLADLQLVAWALGSFRTVDEVKAALARVHIINIDPRGSTIHWRLADATGQQVVLEIVDGKACFYDNPLGVLTNAPGFPWQLTNLNNYVNLHAGAASALQMGAVQLAPFGAGSGMLGLPGDVTPPSRFVRAAFYQTTAPQQPTAWETVLQSFHLLNNFDIPQGVEYPSGQLPVMLPSATQWTSASDLTNRVLYYHTMYNSTIRRISLQKIDFSRVTYHAIPLDVVKEQPVVDLTFW